MEILGVSKMWPLNSPVEILGVSKKWVLTYQGTGGNSECQRSGYLPGYLWKFWAVERVWELTVRGVRCIHGVTGEA